jgi:hypothetical protein
MLVETEQTKQYNMNTQETMQATLLYDSGYINFLQSFF